MAIEVDGVFDLTEWNGYFSEEDNYTGSGSGWVGPGYGGQAYDVEYIGLYIDGSDVYFGLQTGFDVTLMAEDAPDYLPGDFFIDFGNDGSWDIGIDFAINTGDTSDANCRIFTVSKSRVGSCRNRLALCGI